jgi:hypothetical protein
MQAPQQPVYAQMDRVEAQSPPVVIASSAPAVPQKPGFLEEEAAAVVEKAEEPMIGARRVASRRTSLAVSLCTDVSMGDLRQEPRRALG